MPDQQQCPVVSSSSLNNSLMHDMSLNCNEPVSSHPISFSARLNAFLSDKQELIDESISSCTSLKLDLLNPFIQFLSPGQNVDYEMSVKGLNYLHRHMKCPGKREFS